MTEQFPDSTNPPPPSVIDDSAEVTDDAATATARSAVETGAGAGAAAAEEVDPLQEQKDRYLRLAAEYDNYRKRTTREAQQAHLRAQADVIRRLLTSLDDLNRFAHLEPANTDAATVIEGIALVEKNIMKVLDELGLEVLDPLELPFDPALHEAVSTVGAETPDEDHMVAQVYQRGYMLKGQLLRPARVVVKQYL